MYKNKTFILYIVIFIASFLSACNTSDKTESPEITTTFIFSSLTDDDFKEVGTKENVKNDFRKVLFTLMVKYDTNISNRSISVPDLKNVMNSYDAQRYWFGTYATSDNPTEDALYTYEIMFLSKDMTNDTIKSMFSDSNISITWTDKDGQENSKIINLADIIDFK